MLARVATALYGPGDDFSAVWMLDMLSGDFGGWAPKYAY
jgi:hypothetical protein